MLCCLTSECINLQETPRVKLDSVTHHLQTKQDKREFEQVFKVVMFSHL